MSDLDAALLKQIAEGNGHVYRHEARDMAREILRRRSEETAAKLSATQPFTLTPWSGGHP